MECVANEPHGYQMGGFVLLLLAKERAWYDSFTDPHQSHYRFLVGALSAGKFRFTRTNCCTKCWGGVESELVAEAVKPVLPVAQPPAQDAPLPAPLESNPPPIPEPEPIAPVTQPIPDAQAAPIDPNAAAIPNPFALSFTENVGQVDTRVRYLARAKGGTVFFTNDDVVFAIPTEIVSTTATITATLPTTATGSLADGQSRADAAIPELDDAPADPLGLAVARLTYQGASLGRIEPGTKLPGTTNYFSGTDSLQWNTGVANYESISYQELYPGVRVQFDGSENQLKSTYTVAPGVDPAVIQWSYTGAQQTSVDRDGNVQIVLPVFLDKVQVTQPLTITERTPIAWQDVQGVRTPVDVRFQVDDRGVVRFVVSAYDTSLPLVIDPELTYSSYLGGTTGQDRATDVAVDRSGNMYVAGFITNPSFPPPGAQYGTTPTSVAGFVIKITPAGSLAYTAYFAGAYNTQPRLNMKVDGLNQAVVAFSADPRPAYITTPISTPPGVPNPGGSTDVNILKLAASGSSLVFQGWIGSTNSDTLADVAIDTQGSVYIYGRTQGTFPTTSLAFDTTYAGGGGDGFVAKINSAGALVYSTLFGGTSAESPFGMTVTPRGLIYVTGNTGSSGLVPSGVPSFQSSKPEAGTAIDGYVFGIDPTKNQPIYASYVGGDGADYLNDVGVDGAGNIYVTGTTVNDLGVWSNNYPTVGSWQFPEFSSGSSTAYYVVVTKLPPLGGSPLYSLRFLGSANPFTVRGLGIAVESDGTAYLTGETSSPASPFTEVNSITLNGSPLTTSPLDSGAIYVARMDSRGRGASFNTAIGGNGGDSYSTGGLGGGLAPFALDRNGNIYIAGRTASTNFPMAGNPIKSTLTNTINGELFISKISRDPLKADEQRTTRGPCDCQQNTANPINTRTGGYWFSTADVQVETPGPRLAWSRLYASQAITETSTQGLTPGWFHSYSARLLLPGSGGEAGKLVVVSPQGNRERFLDFGSGRIIPVPGVTSQLAVAGANYVQTLPDQTKYTYSGTTGRLLSVTDAQGRVVNLTYNGSNQLTEIKDAGDTTRKLTLTYDANSRISTMTAGARTLTYTYAAAGSATNLTSVLDLRGQTTTYAYYTNSNILWKQTNPLGQVIEEMDYTAYTASGRVKWQKLQDGRRLDLQYPAANLAGTTIITTSLTASPSTILEVQRIPYAVDGTMTGMQIGSTKVLTTTFNTGFQPGTVRDGNNNETQVGYNDAGLPTAMVNAAGQATEQEYDANQNLIRVRDTLGVTTRYKYDSYSNVVSTTVGISTSTPLGLTSRYTYTYDLRYPGDSLIQEQRTPDGVRTGYAYNPQGQVISTTVGLNNAQRLVTGYAYGYPASGSIWKIITTTVGLNLPLAQQRRDISRYNKDGTIASTVQNYQDNTYSAANPDQDITTSYGYDGLGRQIWVRDVLGFANVTRYNAKGQVEATARNVPWPLSFDAQGQPIIPAFSPANPDRSVATLYGYDGLGRTAFVTETGILTGTFTVATLAFASSTSRTTRTEYDALSRPITVTLNYVAGQSSTADRNLQTLTHYDAAGNVTRQRDSYGRWTYTAYDVLNRPIRTIQNYVDGDPLTGARDADIVSRMVYDAAGRVAYSVENAVANNAAVTNLLTMTTTITDRVTWFQYDPLGRTITTTMNLHTALTRNDLNRVSAMRYEPITGQMQAQRDPLGRWVNQQYDALSRVIASTQNCRTGGGAAVPTGCAAFVGTNPDRNLRSQTSYDGLGRVDTSTNPIGVVTKTSYDGLGRTIGSIQNYVQAGATTVVTNVTSLTGYDGLGRAVTVTDPAGKISRMQYNGLGYTVRMTDTLNRVTRQGFDGQGTLRWIRGPDNRITFYQIDGMGRTVATIQNYVDGVVGGSEPSDTDLITRVVYDTAGRRSQQLDALNRITQFAYDNLDRLIGVTENAASGACATAPCNIITSYGYDRAGNRVRITDANDAPNTGVRSFTYDAASQLLTSVDGLNRTTTYSYDLGGRMLGTIDPRGASNNLSYGYDDVDRPKTISATNLGTITQNYDGLGRRVSLVDGSGTTSFDYDRLNRMTKVIAPITGQIDYGYDARGLRTRLTYAGGGTVIDYSYLDDGQLDLVKQGSTTLADYGYDSSGRIQSAARLNGATTIYSYDGADRLLTMTTQQNNQLLASYGYTLNRLGLRTNLMETVPGVGGAPSLAVANDTFTRTVSNGWGPADSGGTWATPGSNIADYAVNGTTARMTVQTSNSTRELLLNTPSPLRDVDMTVRIATDKLPSTTPTAGEIYYTLIARQVSTGNRYRGVVRITSTGTVRLQFQAETGGTAGAVIVNTFNVNGLTAVANSFLRVRMQVTGANPTVLRMRAWADGTPEPTTWTVDVTDVTAVLQAAGSVGVRSFLNSSTANPPIVLSWDDVVVTSPTIAADSFTRTTSNGWGTSDVGGTWATPGSNASNYAVTGGVGQFTLPISGTSRELLLTGGTNTTARDLELTVRIATDKLPSLASGEITYSLLARQISSGNRYRGAIRITPAGAVRLQIQSETGGTLSPALGPGTITVAGLTTAANTFIRVRLHLSGANPTNIRMRAWADGSAEPSTWQLNVADSTAVLQAAGNVGLRGFLNSSTTNYPIVLSWDDLQVTQVRPTALRSIAYSYDGLERLLTATESGATNFSYSYTYDKVGNRTSWFGGLTGTGATYTYNAANQVVGWSYDQAGNLTNEGGVISTYDALNRVTSRSSTTFSYNGDGTLSAQTFGGVTTTYAQDLAAPRSQILGDGTNTYIYGLDRLYGIAAGSRSWYSADALGSIRATLSDTGAVGASRMYDPWGRILFVGDVGVFGYTGELQQGSNVYLRARWYHAAVGSFGSRDPYQGNAEAPQSQHYFAYVHNEPIANTDPSGKCREWGTDNDDPQECDLARIRLAGLNITVTDYANGLWSLHELEIFHQASTDLRLKAGWTDTDFRNKIGRVNASQSADWLGRAFVGTAASALTYPGQRSGDASRIVFYQQAIYLKQEDVGKPLSSADIEWFKDTIVHELAHAWDFSTHGTASLNMMAATKSKYVCWWYEAGGTTTLYGKTNHAEDWAVAVASYVYAPGNIDKARIDYVFQLMQIR